jgi:hypothetical protein
VGGGTPQPGKEMYKECVQRLDHSLVTGFCLEAPDQDGLKKAWQEICSSFPAP